MVMKPSDKFWLGVLITIVLFCIASSPKESLSLFLILFIIQNVLAVVLLIVVFGIVGINGEIATYNVLKDIANIKILKGSLVSLLIIGIPKFNKYLNNKFIKDGKIQSTNTLSSNSVDKLHDISLVNSTKKGRG